MKISYAITTHNEGGYISSVLNNIYNNDLVFNKEIDEIIILDDFSTDIETLQIFEEWANLPAISLNKRKFNGSFAEHKNAFFDLCSGDYIFQLDADELLSPIICENIKEILISAPEIDLFYFPRVNEVFGLTDEDIKNFGWRLNENGWVMWPDYQGRLYRNCDYIRWEGKVHEMISGHKTHTFLPASSEWAIFHYKHIDRQRSQNSFYATL